MTFDRFLPALSVRARIVVIAIIPLIGFLANGIAFTTGEREVDAAFQTVKQANALADASREFKSAIRAMRVSAWDFAVRPSQDLIKSFRDAHELALKSLATVETTTPDRADVDALHNRVTSVATNFANLVQEQEKLGFTDNDGIRGRMREAAAGIERIINANVTEAVDADAQKLLISLLAMRRYEAEYRLSRAQYIQNLFFEEVANLQKMLENPEAAPNRREQLNSQVKTYSDTFTDWIESVDRLRPYLAVIDMEARNMLPTADSIVTVASTGNTDASSALASSQRRT
jgi:methyl-accepting chemotaxis protein